MGTREILATFDTPEKLLSSMLDDQAHGGLFHATLEDFGLGETVVVDVRLPEIPDGVLLVGNIVWRRRPTNWRSSLVPGVGVSFQPESVPQRDFLIRYAQGKQRQRRKAGARCRLNIPVELGVAGISMQAWTRDISRGGLFVPADTPPPVGQPVGVTLLPSEHSTRQELSGRVVWSQGYKAVDRAQGFGVAFRFSNPIQRRRLETIVGSQEVNLYKDAGIARRTMKW